MEPCPYCGEQHAGWLAGLCPRGLLLSVREAAVPKRVGDYEILELLGRGGNGTVYRAREALPKRMVALKMVHLRGLATEKDLSDFLAEVEFHSRFEHPNIVRIYDAKGVSDGHPFYTMQLVEGGSLAQHLARFRDPRRAARLIATVARAVQFCHDAQPNAVLHRDLKPENILIGPDDHPYLTDFGIAKALDAVGGTGSGAVVGTPPYMSPEQLRGRSTPRSDLYSLGAVLYELLTGVPPFATGPAQEVLLRVLDDALVPPRQRDRNVPRDLDLVCRAALEKDSERRYRSAAEFADDLERVLRDEPPLLPQHAKWVRMVHWMGRHPLVSVGITGTVFLLTVIALSALWLLNSQEAELVRSARQINAFAARAQAGAMLNQLREYSERVREAASDITRKATASIGSLRECMAPLPTLHKYTDGFDGMTLFTTEGYACLRWPEPAAKISGLSYTFRDYFVGARALGEAGVARVYLAPAYRSELRGLVEFAMSAPVFDGQGVFRAVLLAMIGSSSALGSVTVDDARKSGRLTVLLAPRGVDRGDAGLNAHVGRFTMLVHPRLEHGEELELRRADALPLLHSFGVGRPPGSQLQAVSTAVIENLDYRDPVHGFEGRWLAAFAPVGGTGYVVLVQSRYEDATHASQTLARTAAIVGGLTGTGFLGLWLFMLRLNRNRRSFG